MSFAGLLPFDGPIITDPLEPCASFVPVRPARKIVRQVCRQVNNRLRDEAKADRAAGHETKAQRVHRCLAAFENYYTYWPTPAELTHYMFTRHEIPKDRVNLVSPRLSDGVNGIVRRGHDGTKIRVGGGLYELLPLRECKINGDSAHPYRIREAGSVLR